jgi:signal transduction histidine kinase/ActR/RegA family two-component response regulator
VTERKHLELARDESVAKLRESEAFNVAVLDSLAAHIAVVDESGVIVAVNNAWRQFAVSNSAPGQAANPVGANYLAVCDHAANSAGAEDALRAAAGIRAILAGEQSSFDWESACHSPGGRRWFHTCLTPLRSKRRGAVISHDNITERQEAQAARTLLESQLRQAQKMEAIGTLAGGIAHDFNNIIATILGNTELARQDARASPKALESLEEIRKAGARARELVKQILSFSRREPTERKAVSLIAVVDESVRVLRMALPPLVQLDVRRDAEVPWVLADATQIGQVLINLVNNAAQAMQGGPGRIGIHLGAVPLDATLAASHPALLEMRAQHPGPLARLVVSDTGPGMDAATLERIFEPFFTTKAVDEGTGLGLAVVHGIVRAHGGAITVESVPGKGAVFTVYLPVIETPIETTQRGATGASAMPAHTPEVGQHILYLDDEEALVFLVKRLLTRRGYRVSGYIMQDEALAALRADPGSFDLVLTDYNMPGMSGLDVAAEVHAIRGDLPVAIASGFVDENLRARASAAGVRDLIFKANAVEEFCDVVQRLLARPS